MKTTLLANFLFFINFFTQPASAQTIDPQITITGTTTDVSTKARPHSYQLTAEKKGEKGALWSASKVNLTDQNWTLTFKAYFGKNENKGSDGLAFVLHTDPRGLKTIGKAENGKHLGFYGIAPSLMVEFDTSNDGAAAGDIAEDHISISKNGSSDKANQIAKAVAAKLNKSGIEDNAEHPVKIEWNADTKTLSVYFDEVLRQTYTNDIVNEIFEGNSEVYWGFTGSSHKNKNRHAIYNIVTTSSPSEATKNASTLPVTLLYFNGAISNTATTLNWATAMEKNSAYFEVQRSSNNQNWETLTRVTATGNSTTKNAYNYTNTTAAGLTYFRLKMVDLDGSAEYSKIISLKANTMTTGLTCYPNPVQNAQTLNIQFTSGAETTVLVSDITGKLVTKQIFRAAGSQHMQLETAGLKPGMYFVNLTSGASKETARVVIQ